MKIEEILRITQGRLLSGSRDKELSPSKISTDSRTVRKGDFFIALKGPRFDGSDFVEEALRSGAAGAIVARQKSNRPFPGKTIIEVRDTTKALEAIASYNRTLFHLPVVAVTGSNGKTTTKEMIYRILSSRYRTLRNEGTKNNNIGVSQTLFRLREDHEACVLELGANHKGEIANLAGISKPGFAVITNIGPSHLEFFGNMSGVFRAKCEILQSFHRRGLVILNGDDKFLSKLRDPSLNIARFGLAESNDFRATAIRVDRDGIRFRLNGGDSFRLNLLGTHNIYNALAAIAVASQFNITHKTMAKALADYRPARMRLNAKRTLNGVEIIDDSYNSNPLSMECALDALRRYPAKARWVVCADMLELGAATERFHEKLGRMVARAGMKGLLTLGKFSKAAIHAASNSGMSKENLWHCRTHDEITEILKKVTSRGDAVLIKGSRGMHMEEVVERLRG